MTYPKKATSDMKPETPLHILRSGDVRVVVAPRLGGRVLALDRAGIPFLWRNPDLLDDALQPRVPLAHPESFDGFATWQNWGGDKSWVAPQGWERDDQWHGPPDAVFDAGAFDVVEASDRRLLLRSGYDVITGLRMTREIEARDDGMRITTTLRNESHRPRRWAGWEIAQVPVADDDLDRPGPGVFVRVRGTADPVPLFSLRGSMTTENAEGLIHVPFAQAIGKLGFADSIGTVEVVHADGSALRLRFGVEATAEYPDGCAAQVWMQTPTEEPLAELGGLACTAALVELEATSPLTELSPGDALALTCDWECVPPGRRPHPTAAKRSSSQSNMRSSVSVLASG
ncbi:DUF4380 domain-containing protein [Humibacter soli]